ncbi:hypothetical protein D3C87_1232210 [compost metagenome]
MWFANHHRHPSQCVLTGLVDTASQSVAQGIFVTTLLELVMRTMEITFVINPLLDLRVLFFGVVQLNQDVSGLHDVVDFTQRQTFLAAKDFLVDVGGVDAPGHELASPGVFIQGITDKAIVEFFSVAALRHLGYCCYDDLLPVNKLSETLGAPFPPAQGFTGIERYHITIAFDELFNHGFSCLIRSFKCWSFSIRMLKTEFI